MDIAAGAEKPWTRSCRCTDGLDDEHEASEGLDNDDNGPMVLTTTRAIREDLTMITLLMEVLAQLQVWTSTLVMS